MTVLDHVYYVVMNVQASSMTPNSTVNVLEVKIFPELLYRVSRRAIEDQFEVAQAFLLHELNNAASKELV